MLDVAVHKAIRTAIKSGNLEEVQRLIDGDKSRLEMMTPFGTWLHVAAAYGQIDIAQWLISMGADVNARGETFEGAPLDQAAGEGHLEMVEYLIDAGARLDTSEPTRNPLFAATYGGHTKVAQLLIDRGIDTTVRYSGEHMTDMDALAFAREYGRSEIVELLERAQRQETA